MGRLLLPGISHILHPVFIWLAADYPLTKFRNRVGPEDRAIGYGKGAYVFHILKNILGEEKFYEGLRYVIKNRSFKDVSNDDLIMNNIYIITRIR